MIDSFSFNDLTEREIENSLEYIDGLITVSEDNGDINCEEYLGQSYKY